MQKLTPLAKGLIGVICVGSAWAAVLTYGKRAQLAFTGGAAAGTQLTEVHALSPNSAAPNSAAPNSAAPNSAAPNSAGQARPSSADPAIAPATASGKENERASLVPPPHLSIDDRPVRVALSQWPGHLALVVGAGGLVTQPGSAAAEAGLNLQIEFIEDAASKNKALATGAVDFVWQTVDEMPISLATFTEAEVPVRAFLQIDWSRGGDACVAAPQVKTVEDIRGRRSAMLMFSPDHTVFEFMIANSRLTAREVAEVRAATQFSLDDFTFGRKLFAQGKVDVACLWEPDVTLALAERPGAHRLFSTAEATELVADVLLARQDLLDARPDVAEKLARLWFRSVQLAEANRPKAARLITDTCSRFEKELGYDKTLAALGWAKWTTLADNVRFFGLDQSTPAFDRVYNQADSIWINYPQAEIRHRFPPSTLRDARMVRNIWEAAGKPPAGRDDTYNSSVAFRGEALFTKPVSINFATASALLGPTAFAVINREILPQLEIARGMYVRVEGNTDTTGDNAINVSLSLRRAQAIVEYLVMRGVPKDRLVARGNGSSKPVAKNETPEGRAQNRRTDVLFIRSEG